MGGFSHGFSKAGYSVHGVDSDPRAGRVYERNDLGTFTEMDLSGEFPDLRPALVIGGPPCRPWSVLNLHRRTLKHPDKRLVNRFFQFVSDAKPSCFVMENVRGVGTDSSYLWWVRRLAGKGYAVDSLVARYSDWGAPTARHRLFTFGFDDPGDLAEFKEVLLSDKQPSRSVMDVIQNLTHVPSGAYPDHIWPNFRTIDRYSENYRTGKFGWYRPDPDSPSPSFGNVTKTYILHPLAGLDGVPLRVISVREAMSIMGFPRGFSFPTDLAMRRRYQMVADSVSPVFSSACARAMRRVRL